MKSVSLRLAAVLAAAMVMVAAPAWADGVSDYHVANDALYRCCYAEAIQYYTMAIESGDLVPGSLATAYNRRGVAYQKTGQCALALKDYDKAAKIIPDFCYKNAQRNRDMLLSMYEADPNLGTTTCCAPAKKK